MQHVLHSAPWLSAMARVFDRADAPLYVVGGGVRNPLMGLDMSDADVCGPLLPEEVCRICEGTEVRTRIRAAALGTVELYVTDENGVEQMAEYTAWRQDVYDGGHTPSAVRFTTDIAVDARRRDFSVNAMYRRLHDGWVEDIADPTGGVEHLRLGILHTTTEDPDLILGFDGQRILRAARFQAEMDLVPTPETMASLRRNRRLMEDISLERHRAEVEKLIMADLRYPALKRRHPATKSGLDTLAAIGAWAYLFPGTAYDEEAALALERLNGPLSERMALLFRHSTPDALRGVMLRLRFPAREADAAARVLAAYQQPNASLRELADFGPDVLRSAAAMARALNGNDALHRAALERIAGKPLSVRELAISGHDLKPVFVENNRPLREMGALLEKLWLDVLAGNVANDHDALMQEAFPTE